MRFNTVRRFGLILGGAACLVSRGMAQRNPAGDSLLARLTQEAIRSAPAVLRADAQARAAASRVRPAGAPADPMLVVGVMDLTLPRFAFRESDFTEVDVELSQALPWPGTLRAQTRAAAAAARGALAGTAALRRDIITRVASSYHRLRYVVAAQQILATQRRLLGSAVEISTARYGTGSAPQSDPLQARSALARLEADSAALAAEESSLRAELRAVRGIHGPEALAVAPIDVASITTILADTAARLAPPEGRDPLLDHPRLQSRTAEIESVEQTVRVATLQGRPDFVVTWRYGARPLGSDFFSAFAGIRLPIWAGRKQRLLTEAARAEADAARRSLDEERAALSTELDRTRAEARASATRLRLLVQRVLPLTGEGVEAALREYRTGQVGFLNVLTAQDAAYRTALEAAEIAATYLTQLVLLEQLLAPEGSQ